ncbi:hypothetical protein D3C81_08520 [compost metagenome]
MEDVILIVESCTTDGWRSMELSTGIENGKFVVCAENHAGDEWKVTESVTEVFKGIVKSIGLEKAKSIIEVMEKGVNMTKYEKVKLLIRDGDICDFINSEHGRMFGIYLGGELHYTQENGVVATLSGFESQITVIRRPYSLRTSLTCFKEEPVYNYDYKKYTDFNIIYDEDKEYEIQLSLFFKGDRTICCKTKKEVYEFLNFLIVVGIVWKGDNPIVAIGNFEAKTGIYYTLEDGKLVWSSWEEDKKVVNYSNIPKELVSMGLAIGTEGVNFSNLTNCHAIKCNSREESVKLFEYLGEKGVWRSLVGPCNRHNELWNDLNGDVAYVVANKQFVCGNNIEEIKKLGYSIIDFKDFVLEDK